MNEFENQPQTSPISLTDQRTLYDLMDEMRVFFHREGLAKTDTEQWWAENYGRVADASELLWSSLPTEQQNEILAKAENTNALS